MATKRINNHLMGLSQKLFQRIQSPL